MSHQKSTLSTLSDPKFTTITIDNTSSHGGILSITDTTESTSTTTGSLITTGGIGLAKSIYIGEDLTVTDDATVGGNLAVTGTLQVADVTTIQDTTNSTSKDTGCLILEGGLGIEKDVVIGPTTGGASIATVSIVTNDDDKAMTLGCSSATTGELLILSNSNNSAGAGLSIDAQHNSVEYGSIKLSEVQTNGVGTEDSRMKFNVVSGGVNDTFMEFKGDTRVVDIGASDITTEIAGDLIMQHGTVTQTTSIATSVTVNAPSGVITTVADVSSITAQTVATFTVTNDSVLATSVVSATVVDYAGTYATNGLPVVNVDNIGAGSFDIIVINAHDTNSLSATGTLKISFISV